MGRSVEYIRKIAKDSAPVPPAEDVEVVSEGGAAGLPVLIPGVSGRPAAPERAGFLGSFKKGLFAPPADWGGSAGTWSPSPSLGWALGGSSDAERDALVPSQDFTAPEGHNPAPIPLPPARIGDDIPNPVTGLEKFGFALGQEAPLLVAGAAAAPGLGAQVGMGALESALIETAVATGAIGAGVAAGEAGLPGWAQGGAEILTSMAAPSVSVTRGPRVVGRLIHAPEGAVDASQEVAEYVATHYGAGTLPPGTRPPDASDAFDAAVELQRQFPVGVEDAGRFRRDAADRIDEVQEQFPDPLRQPSLSQAMTGEGLEDLGGYNLAKRELQYSAADPDYAAANYGRRLETLEWAEQAYQNETPAFAGYAHTRVRTREVMDDAEAEAARLWKDVPIEDMPNINADELVEKLAVLRDDIPRSKYLPREADSIDKLVEKFEGEIPYSQLQSLSSELSMTVRAGRAAGPMNEKAWRRKGAASELLKVVESMLDSADPGDVASLRAARAATKRAKSLNTPAMAEILENGDPVDVLNTLRRSDDIAEEVYRLREVLGEDGIAGLRAAAWDEVFGETLGSRSVAQMRNTLKARNNKQLYDALFEPEQLQVIRQNINRQARAGYGKASTSGQAHSTGTGYQADTLEALQVLQNGGTLTAQMVESLRRGYRRLGSATGQSLSIEKLASQDLELAKMLLRTPTNESLPALNSVWRNALARAHRRAPGAFSTGSGAIGASRVANDSMVVEPNPDDLARIRALRGSRP